MFRLPGRRPAVVVSRVSWNFSEKHVRGTNYDDISNRGNGTRGEIGSKYEIPLDVQISLRYEQLNVRT